MKYNPIKNINKISESYLYEIEQVILTSDIKPTFHPTVNHFKSYNLDQELCDSIFLHIFYLKSLVTTNPSVKAFNKIGLDQHFFIRSLYFTFKQFLSEYKHSTNPQVSILLILHDYFSKGKGIEFDYLNPYADQVLVQLFEKTFRQYYLKNKNYVKERMNFSNLDETSVSMITLLKELNHNLFHMFITVSGICSHIPTKTLFGIIAGKILLYKKGESKLKISKLTEKEKIQLQHKSFLNLMTSLLGLNSKMREYPDRFESFKQWLYYNKVLLESTKTLDDSYNKAIVFTSEFALFIMTQIFKNFFDFEDTATGRKATITSRYAHTIQENVMFHKPFLYPGQKYPDNIEFAIVANAAGLLDRRDFYAVSVNNKIMQRTEIYYNNINKKTSKGSWLKKSLQKPQERYKISDFYKIFYTHLEKSYDLLLSIAFFKDDLNIIEFKDLYQETWQYLLRIIYNINFDLIMERALTGDKEFITLLQSALDLENSAIDLVIGVRAVKLMINFEITTYQGKTYENKKLINLGKINKRAKKAIIDSFETLKNTETDNNLFKVFHYKLKCAIFWFEIYEASKEFFKAIKRLKHPYCDTIIQRQNRQTLLESFYNKIEHAKYMFKGFLFEANIYQHFTYFFLQELMIYTGRMMTNTGFLNPMNYALSRAFIVFYSKNSHLSLQSLYKYRNVAKYNNDSDLIQHNLTTHLDILHSIICKELKPIHTFYNKDDKIFDEIKDLVAYSNKVYDCHKDIIKSNLKVESISEEIPTFNIAKDLPKIFDNSKRDRSSLLTLRLWYNLHNPNLFNNEEPLYALDCSNSGFQHIFMAFREQNANTVNLTGSQFFDAYKNVAEHLKSFMLELQQMIILFVQSLDCIDNEKLRYKQRLQNNMTTMSTISLKSKIAIFTEQQIHLDNLSENMPILETLLDYFKRSLKDPSTKILLQLTDHFIEEKIKTLFLFANMKDLVGNNIKKVNFLRKSYTNLSYKFDWIIPKRSLIQNKDIIKYEGYHLTKALIICYYYIKNWHNPQGRNKEFMLLEPFYQRNTYKQMVMAFAYGMTFLRSCETIMNSTLAFMITQKYFNLNMQDLQTLCKTITRFFLYYYVPKQLPLQQKFLNMNKAIAETLLTGNFNVIDDFIKWSFKPRIHVKKRLKGRNIKNKHQFTLNIQVPTNKNDKARIQRSICPIIIHYADSALARLIWFNITKYNQLYQQQTTNDFEFQLYKIHDSFSCNLTLAPIFKEILWVCFEEHLHRDWFKSFIYPNIKHIPAIKKMFETTVNKNELLSKITNPFFVRL